MFYFTWRTYVVFFSYAVVPMSRFLRFPNTSVSRVGKGPSLAEGGDVEMHVTRPLGPKEPLPNKTGLQRVVEKPDQRVTDSRLAKERKKQASQPRNVSKKRLAVTSSSRPHKRASASSIVVSEDDGSSNDDRTRSPSPINISHPDSGNVDDDEQTEDVEDVEDVERPEDVENAGHVENASHVEVPVEENVGNAGGVNPEENVENVVPENVDGDHEGDGLSLDTFATELNEGLDRPIVSDLAHGGMSI